MDLLLKNKIVIVTGGASGIGEAVVKTFASEGAIPVLLDFNYEKSKALEASLKASGQESLALQVDLRDENACRKGIEKVLEKYGSIYILVNNAGRNDGVKLGRPVADFRQSLEDNLVHFYTIANLCLEPIKQSKGNIINIASKVALTGQGATSGYAAAKGGILSLTREWAVQLLKDGIRVNAVVPAEVWTPLYESVINHLPDKEALLEKIHQSIPFGNRMTTPEEVANMIVFLSSPRASHVTGQFIFVDGGYTHLDRLISVNSFAELKQQKESFASTALKGMGRLFKR